MRKVIKVIGKIILFIFVIFLLFVAFWIGAYLFHRKHDSVSTQVYQFAESSKELNNPYRGFYSIYGFTISDEEQDYEWHVSQYLCRDTDELVLLQINLCNYADGEISPKGMENLDALFTELEQTDKHYIIRFLYDWEGKGREKEPKHMDIILKHMEQLEPVFHKYQESIFIHQGIFVGDCGEMHGSKFLSDTDMKTLLSQLVKVTPTSVYLSVRTPQHWRIVTETSEPLELNNHEFAFRLGLFNDGMMGTLQDTGTYGVINKSEAGDYGKWTRTEELLFQEMLCQEVPNGGEVIIDNPINDFQNAIGAMEIMHVTYLNRLHDKEVLDKWAASVVTEEGCYKGMDGLSYIERHLGYRLLIKDAALNYDYYQDKLTVEINLQNVGFAPMYREAEVFCILKSADSNDYLSFQIDEDIRSLCGGRESNTILTLQKEIELAGYAPGQYNLYFYIKDVITGQHILLANEQDEEEYGYKIGSIVIDPICNPFTGEEIDLKFPQIEWLQGATADKE